MFSVILFTNLFLYRMRCKNFSLLFHSHHLHHSYSELSHSLNVSIDRYWHKPFDTMVALNSLQNHQKNSHEFIRTHTIVCVVNVLKISISQSKKFEENTKKRNIHFVKFPKTINIFAGNNIQNRTIQSEIFRTA